jgi:hypothetical protein
MGNVRCFPYGPRSLEANLIPRSSVDYMPWYSGKAEVHDYLVELNKTEKGGILLKL